MITQQRFEQHFANQLNKLMNENGISVRELARRLDVSPATISRWTTGKQTTILSGCLFDLCDVFDVDPLWFTREESEI